jgi:hypothetical protein
MARLNYAMAFIHDLWGHILQLFVDVKFSMVVELCGGKENKRRVHSSQISWQRDCIKLICILYQVPVRL